MLRRPRKRARSAAPDLLTENQVCALIGGSAKPISRHTLYRQIASGRLPQGVRVGPNTVRYVRAEIEAALRAIIDARVMR